MGDARLAKVRQDFILERQPGEQVLFGYLLLVLDVVLRPGGHVDE